MAKLERFILDSGTTAEDFLDTVNDERGLGLRHGPSVHRGLYQGREATDSM
jgi:hypothetical protein